MQATGPSAPSSVYSPLSSSQGVPSESRKSEGEAQSPRLNSQADCSDSSPPHIDGSEGSPPSSLSSVHLLRRSRRPAGLPVPVLKAVERASGCAESILTVDGLTAGLGDKSAESQTPTKSCASSGDRELPKSWTRANGPVAHAATTKKPVYQTRRKPPPKEYHLSDPSSEERDKIMRLFADKPEFTQKYDYRVRKVRHEVLERQFNSKKEALKLANSEALIGSWKGRQEQEIRTDVDQWVHSKKSPTEYDGVHTITACHATKPKFLEAVLRAGLHCLAKTDQGYFGQGIYVTTCPEYSVLYGGRRGGIILLCEIAFRALFPVAASDDLMGKPILPGFDGHAVQVVPKTKNPNEMMYVCRKPGQKTTYDEIVVRDPSQILIRYVLEYSPKASFSTQISEKLTRGDLRQCILDYIRQQPLSDQLIALTQKLDEIESSLQEVLDRDEMDLCTMLKRCIGERDTQTQKNLGERIQHLLLRDDTPEYMASQLPSGFIEDQERLDQSDGNLQAADDCLKLNDHRKALTSYQAVLRYSPQSFCAHVGCGKVYYQREDWDNAVYHFREALKIKPKDDQTCKSYVSALVERARRYIKTKNHSEAALDLIEALKFDGSHCIALGLLASLYFHKDCGDQAYCMANRALSINPRYAPALRVRGAYYACLGEKKYCNAALADLNESLSYGKSTFALIYRARLFISMNQWSKALDDCQEILKSDAKNMDGLTTQAKVFLLQNDSKQAEKALKKCEKAAKDDFVFHALRGWLFLQKDDLHQALECLNKSIETYQAWRRQEIARHSKILKKKDALDYYEFLLLRAEIHHRMNSASGAIQDYQETIRLFPENPAAYRKRAHFYRSSGDERKAQADETEASALELKKNSY